MPHALAFYSNSFVKVSDELRLRFFLGQGRYKITAGERPSTRRDDFESCVASAGSGGEHYQ